MAYDPVTNTWDLGLRARGVVIMGAGAPIVLCAMDWIGIANEGHDAFRTVLAEAAGTTPQRVAVHSLHQHDAPECDFGAEKILQDEGLLALNYEGSFARDVLRRLSGAIRESIPRARVVTQLGLGEAPVQQVASNRRILGSDGKVRAVRWTATADPAVRAEPEGLIDPMVSLISFWEEDSPIAVLSYYATHPQSYYRTGIPNPDFPGIARFERQLAVPEALHVHFNGAGGNIGAGKYNDGSKTNRAVLGKRLADGMRRAWEATRKRPLSVEEVGWEFEPVRLAPRKEFSKALLEAQLRGRDAGFLKGGGPTRLAWVRRCEAGHSLEISCLRLAGARVLHLPGEPFVEYQLAARAARPDLMVATAAYGDYGPWYIGTSIAYAQGGYETEPSASNVGPEAEPLLMAAIQKLLAR